ncbi:transcriptional regulator, AsnC family, partial [mine drainage metagenome]
AAISKRIGLPYSTTLYWIRKLGKKYGIRYTIEPLFLNRFGLFRFVAIAKFKNKRPKVETLRKLLESKPQIQAAFMAKGAYDFFMFFLAPDPAIAEDLVYEIRSDKALASYPSHWYSSYYTQGLGYIPLRDELFTLLKGRVWARTKETPHKHSNQLFLREYAT